MLGKLLRRILPARYSRQWQYIGLKNALVYWFFQRVLRINSHVPWPVHWGSIVSHPDKIVRKHWRPFPGYMPGQYIQARNGIVIGRNVRLGPGVQLVSANHDLLNYDLHIPTNPIEIGDNCWLGANAIILPGVKLGNHVVVAAGAVVTKSFPDNCLVGGVPAVLLKTLEPYAADSDW